MASSLLIAASSAYIPVLTSWQGQNEDYDAVKAKAEKIGAERMIIQNLQQELVDELVWPAVQCVFGRSPVRRAQLPSTAMLTSHAIRQRDIRRRLPLGHVVGQACHCEGDDESGQAI